MSDFLEAGKIVSTHALKGEVKVDSWCNSPSDLCDLEYVFIGKGKDKIYIDNARVAKSQAILKLRHIDTQEEAEKLRNTVIYIERSQLNLDEGDNFIADLIGLSVRDVDTDEVYGEIIDVIQTGANDVYVIRGSRGELLVPALADVVISIDISKGLMTIRPLEGLFDDI